MSTPQVTRETLLHRLHDQDDEAAWEEFVDLYRPYAYTVIRNLGVETSTIEDVLQDVLLIAWKQLPTFDYDAARGRFRSWLCTIINRKVYALRERKQREAGQPETEAPAIEPEVEALIEREWEKHVADLAWSRIEERFEPQVLAAFQALAEGRKGDEVAAELGLSVNSVYVYKKRVLAALHKEISYLDA